MRIRSYVSLGMRPLAGCVMLTMLACGGSSGSNSAPPNNPPTNYTLTVNSTNPATAVAIAVSPADANGSGNGSTGFTRTYASGVSVTLTAPATSGGNTFASWTGCATASTVTCTVSITANTTVTANYSTSAPATYVLTVTASNPASGVAIAVSPTDANGSGAGSTSFTRTYASGASVTLTAPASSGANVFSSWTGCTSASALVCMVSVNANTTVTANYTTPAPTTYVLTIKSSNPASGVAIGVSPVDVNSSGSGTTTFTRTYAAGASVMLTAPATSGANTFSSWTGCTSATALVCMIAVNANATVTANYATPPPPAYTLTVNSTNPASGIAIVVTPVDINSSGNGVTTFTRTYNAAANVTLTAPTTSSTGTFSSWTGCTSATNVTCAVILNANTTVTANYVANGVTALTITPNPGSAAIGTTVQFTASVQGNGSFSKGVTWSVAAPSGSPGDITAAGLYTTPSPAPASVTITATSTADATKSASITLTLAAPAATTGPALMVDAGTPTRAISPLIYGVNGYDLDTATAKAANVSIIRWGGDNVSRYNYVANTSNSAADYYFESFSGAGGQWPDGSFNGVVTQSAALGAEVVGTAPVIGWVTTSNVAGSGTSNPACSFQKATYPNQQSFNYNCGNGVDANGTSLVGNNTIAALTSMPEPPPTPPAAGTAVGPSWIGNWVTSLTTQFGPGNPATGAGKGVAHWDLDNEPEYWSAVHRDVHPVPMTYDEVTNGGIGTALAIKTADPTALVSGPVISGWYNYFYSEQDVDDGYGAGPCYKPWGNPVDRKAHGGVPFIEYYLQQMQAAQTTYGKRLLDYVDIHTYFAANYNGSSTGLTTAGDTAEQIIRLNSTRVFWDPTYTDPSYTQPNYLTDANYTTSCSPPAQAPQLIPTLQSWVAKDYPGTKTSIDEYNFGGMEAINGALTQADILGIFGKYGLDKGMLWPTTNYSTQVPGTEAFAIYRNYDGADSGFGDMALSSTTASQGQLSIYGAKRTSDGAVTIVIINKTFGDLSSTLTLPNLTPTGPAKVFLYSNANLSAIVAQPAQTLTPPVAPATANTLTMTFPAQSITLLVVPTT